MSKSKKKVTYCFCKKPKPIKSGWFEGFCEICGEPIKNHPRIKALPTDE
jgi:RNA polymerase-binding transcription factor DksA